MINPDNEEGGEKGEYRRETLSGLVGEGKDHKMGGPPHLDIPQAETYILFLQFASGTVKKAKDRQVGV